MQLNYVLFCSLYTPKIQPKQTISKLNFPTCGLIYILISFLIFLIQLTASNYWLRIVLPILALLKLVSKTFQGPASQVTLNRILSRSWKVNWIWHVESQRYLSQTRSATSPLYQTSTARGIHCGMNTKTFKNQLTSTSTTCSNLFTSKSVHF